MRKYIVAAIVFCVLTFPALAGAHDAKFERQIKNLKARLDAGEARWNQNKSINDLYRLADELKARLDAGDASWNQNREVDDLYRQIDALKKAIKKLLPAPARESATNKEQPSLIQEGGRK